MPSSQDHMDEESNKNSNSELAPETAHAHSPKQKTRTAAVNSNYCAFLKDTARDPNAAPGPKKIIVMRHGERLDDLFPNWVHRCQGKGYYEAFDSNMPVSLEPLNRDFESYVGDTPLSQMGTVQAQLVGRGLHMNGLTPDAIYCSPSLRCVQTASIVSRSARATCKLRIEPGLFENNDSYPTSRPRWLSVDELSDAGFDVDRQYKAMFSSEMIWKRIDNVSTFNKRMDSTFAALFGLESMNNPEGNVLIVAHASTVYFAVGYFEIPRRKLVENDFFGLATRVPYCNTAVFRRHNDACSAPNGIWKWEGNGALPPISYKDFSSRGGY